MPGPHRHQTVEFNLVIEGTATYLLAGRRYELRPQTLVWLFPRQEHFMASRSPTYRDWLGLFEPALVRRVCTTPATQTLLKADPPGNFARRLSIRAATTLENLFEHISHSGTADAVDAGLGFALLAAWEAFQTSDQVPPSSPVHRAVVDAARILQTEPHPANLPTLAHRVGLSPHHLSRLFRQQIGMSLSQFRNEQRLRRFLENCRADRQTTILDAALNAGFGSYAQFHRVFSQLTGTRPSSYLRYRH